jgi:non-ribosomal peptide synthetase component F
LQTFAAEICRAYLAPPQVARLKQLSRRHQATLYMTLLASFGVLLARYSGQDDIVVGSPIANRQEANLEQMIGFFVNPLVLRMRIKPAMSFADLLAQVRRTALDSYEHQDVPFERLVEEISPQRSLNSSPIFQVVFTMQDLQDPPQMKDLQVERLRPDQLQVHVDLEVHIREREGGIQIVWLYNRDLFDRWRIEQMARHYARILDATQADVHGALGKVDLLDAAERLRLLEEWNDPKWDTREI